MTAAAIARLAGVGRAAVSNWRKRYPDFPRPLGGPLNSPTFARGEVVAWLTATGKADQLATAGRTDGGTLRSGRGEFDLAGARVDVFQAPMRGTLPEQQRERSMSDLRPADLLARSMVALLPRVIAPERAPGGETERALEDERWAPDSRPGPGELGGPGMFHQGTGTDLAAKGPYDGGPDDGPALPVVIDPACGPALALMAVADRFGGRVRLVGQDVDEKAARIAAFNLSGNSHGARYEVHTGDSLTDSQLGDYLGRAAAVVCEPPLDRPDWPVAELTTDPRWEFGIPAPRDAEMAWVQHCYAQLRPQGVAIVALSQRACVALPAEHIRAALIRSGVLRMVVTLPTGMGSAPGTGICLWMLRRPSGAPERGPVAMIDLSGLADPAEVPIDFTAWQHLLGSADPGLVRDVDRLELLDEGACLLPSRFLTPTSEVSADDLNRVRQRLASVYAGVARGLPRYRPAKAALAGRRTYVTLAELERAGALTVRARDDTPRPGDVLLRTQGRPPVVATTITTEDDEIGQLVDVPGIAQVIEIDSGRLDPHFVALFLREDVAALPVANTLGAINRDDLRRCRIPRLPLIEQRKYGDAFRQLSELEQALTRLSDLSAKVIEQAISALTSGAIAPDFELPAMGRPAGQDEAALRHLRRRTGRDEEKEWQR